MYKGFETSVGWSWPYTHPTLTPHSDVTNRNPPHSCRNECLLSSLPRGRDGLINTSIWQKNKKVLRLVIDAIKTNNQSDGHGLPVRCLRNQSLLLTEKQQAKLSLSASFLSVFCWPVVMTSECRVRDKVIIISISLRSATTHILMLNHQCPRIRCRIRELASLRNIWNK